MEKRRIPNSLKKYRRLAGLSQKDVAEAIGLKYSPSISKWENGLSFPGIEQVLRLSLLFKTVPNHLYFEFYQELKKDSAEKEYKLFLSKARISSDKHLVT